MSLKFERMLIRHQQKIGIHILILIKIHFERIFNQFALKFYFTLFLQSSNVFELFILNDINCCSNKTKCHLQFSTLNMHVVSILYFLLLFNY